MPVYATFFLFIVLSSVGLPLLNGFIGEFLVLSGAFQAKALYGVLAATGVIWSACYLLWMYQRVFFGELNPRQPAIARSDWRERAALWPTALAALVMGVLPSSGSTPSIPRCGSTLGSVAQTVAQAVGR